jgi:tRNA/tmRNA/rRNA uracil-C5-methylase (TrmA/RlmC/RlmD family)
VLAAARNGFQSHGVELNSILLWYSKFTAFRNGLRNASFSREDLFKIDYSQYKNIVIFGVDEMVSLVYKEEI